jgi:hypothetical protein
LSAPTETEIVEPRRLRDSAQFSDTLVCDDPTAPSTVEPKRRRSAIPKGADPSFEPAVDVYEVALRLKVTPQSIWNGVRRGRIRPPFYPLEMTPRWWWSEIAADVEATRCKPGDKPQRLSKSGRPLGRPRKYPKQQQPEKETVGAE